MTPKVTFVVPCYNLAHFLPECLDSILTQTYRQLEVIIMDDCSPDDTPRVAQAFKDPRVRYVRNETNLGHLRNYNKGIELANGEYIWLISADDKLRNPNVLERYVKVMETYPNVGYAFSSGMFFENGKETRLIEDAWWGDRDFISDGHKFFVRLYGREANMVCPSCMARKECYEKLSMFVLDMPHSSDVYLWSLWALKYDVAYFAEPMVDYRIHNTNIMHTFRRSGALIENLVMWQTRIKHKAAEFGLSDLTRSWAGNLADLYAYALLNGRFSISSHFMDFDEFEKSLRKHTDNPADEKKIRARVYASFADGCYKNGELGDTRRYYSLALTENRWMPKLWVKYILLRAGKVGLRLRTLLADRRQDKRRSDSAASAAEVG